MFAQIYNCPYKHHKVGALHIWLHYVISTCHTFNNLAGDNALSGTDGKVANMRIHHHHVIAGCHTRRAHNAHAQPCIYHFCFRECIEHPSRLPSSVLLFQYSHFPKSGIWIFIRSFPSYTEMNFSLFGATLDFQSWENWRVTWPYTCYIRQAPKP